jgi:hypothetical protein
MHGGEEKCVHRFCRNTLRNRLLGILKCKWEHNIKMDLKIQDKRIGLDSSGQGTDQSWALMNMVMNPHVS